MDYIREDQADLRVTLNGIAFGDSWKSAEGGDLEADTSKTRPGGMGRSVSVGGPAERNDLTLTTQSTDIVAGWHKTFEAAVGNGRVKAGTSWLSPQRGPIGPAFPRVGILKSCAVPNVDSESSEPGMYTIVVDCDELAA